MLLNDSFKYTLYIYSTPVSELPRGYSKIPHEICSSEKPKDGQFYLPVCLYSMCMYGAHRGQELRVVVSHHAGARN